MTLCEATQYSLVPAKKYEHNILLHRDEVGKVKHSIHDVPDIVFGKRSGLDKETSSKDVIFNWQEFDGGRSTSPKKKSHNLSPEQSSSIYSSNNSNKKVSSAKSGSSSSARSSSRGKKNDKSYLPSEKDSTFTYGTATKYGETAADVIQFRYEDDWKKEKLAERQIRKEKEQSRKEKMNSLRDTGLKKLIHGGGDAEDMTKNFSAMNPFYNESNAQSPNTSSVPTTNQLQPGSNELFKMKKFKDVPARVDTRR